jgi:hypothetical protein
VRAKRCQRVTDLVQLERLNDRSNYFHVAFPAFSTWELWKLRANRLIAVEPARDIAAMLELLVASCEPLANSLKLAAVKLKCRGAWSGAKLRPRERLKRHRN